MLYIQYILLKLLKVGFTVHPSDDTPIDVGTLKEEEEEGQPI